MTPRKAPPRSPGEAGCSWSLRRSRANSCSRPGMRRPPGCRRPSRRRPRRKASHRDRSNRPEYRYHRQYTECSRRRALNRSRCKNPRNAANRRDPHQRFPERQRHPRTLQRRCFPHSRLPFPSPSSHHSGHPSPRSLLRSLRCQTRSCPRNSLPQDRRHCQRQFRTHCDRRFPD